MLQGSCRILSNLPDVRLSSLGNDLIPAKAIKDLSVTFDPNLTFYDHILKTVSSCMPSLTQISRVKHMFDKNTFMAIINALVFSNLFYRSSVWSNTAATHLLKLQAEQNFAARIISDTRKFDNITPILKDLRRRLPVKSQLCYRDAVLSFKCMSGLTPPYLALRFLKRGEVCGRVTRNSHLLNIPCFNSATGQKTFLYRTFLLQDYSDHTFQLRESVFVFKRKCRNKLLREFF